MKPVALAGLAISLALAATAANAATVVVDAAANSSSGGTGAVTGFSFVAGDLFTVTVDADDLWNAGSLPRWSDADGLDGPAFATGADESGQTAGTQISADFGFWSQDGFSARYGALVGKIGSTYAVIGKSFAGPAWDTGALTLYYWDSNSGDNTEHVTATITAVPEPAAWAMMIAGFGLTGAALRRRRLAPA